MLIYTICLRLVTSACPTLCGSLGQTERGKHRLPNKQKRLRCCLEQDRILCLKLDYSSAALESGTAGFVLNICASGASGQSFDPYHHLDKKNWKLL